MKVAVSIPRSIFDVAEAVAEHLGLSRSALYARALGAFVKRYRGKEVTERLNAVYVGEESRLDKALQRLQSASLPPEDW